MQSLPAAVMAVCLTASSAVAADRLEELLTKWEKTPADFQSLVVEFGLEVPDSVTGDVERSSGVLRLIRTAKGELLGSYELQWDGRPGEKRDSVLLIDGSVYMLDYRRKVATRIRVTDGELFRLAESYLHPVVALLDRKRTFANWEPKVLKQDANYTYLVLKAKQAHQSGWVTASIYTVRVAVLNKATESIPQDAPRLVEYSHQLERRSFHIHAWRLNGPDAPKPEEFVKPENWPGWQVFDLSGEAPKK